MIELTNVLITAITAAGSVLVAIAGLLLNYRGFNSIERRLEIIDNDIKSSIGLSRREAQIKNVASGKTPAQS